MRKSINNFFVRTTVMRASAKDVRSHFRPVPSVIAQHNILERDPSNHPNIFVEILVFGFACIAVVIGRVPVFRFIFKDLALADYDFDPAMIEAKRFLPRPSLTLHNVGICLILNVSDNNVIAFE
jgi:hypothetical protein